MPSKQLDLLLAGTRTEDIDQARANLANAEATFARHKDLAARNVSSQQQLDHQGWRWTRRAPGSDRPARPSPRP
jgi:multidrug resistance efflux pump